MSTTNVDLASLNDYVLAGYDLLPLHPWNRVDAKGRERGKSPLEGGWRRKRYAVAGVLQHAANGGNVGVRLRADHLVVDVDPRRFPEGRDPLQELQAEGILDLTGVPHVVTGGGGHHYYFTKDPGISVTGSLKAYPGVEFKSQGFQVVAAGSVHPTGTGYEWDLCTSPLDKAVGAPKKLLDLIRKPAPQQQDGAGALTPEELKALLDQLPVETYAEHDHWFKLMCAAHHATDGLGRQEFINWSTGDPEYSDDAWQIAQRWDSLDKDKPGATTYRSLIYEVMQSGGEVPAIGADMDFDVFEGSNPGGAAEPSPLEVMNETACVVDEAGKFRIYREKYDPPMDRTFWARSGKQDFIDLVGPKYIEVPAANGGTKLVQLAKAWLEWPLRRQYEGIIFDPEKDHDGYLNMWTGWTVDPAPGDWSLLRNLIRDVLCAGDEESYEYVMNWLAYLFQRPGQVAEVALVFRGEKGTGKGTLGRAVATICGRHGIQLTNPEHLTGRFNLHLKDCIFLFPDEAFWAGDKRHEGVLKGIVTEPTIVIEGKGRDLETCPNRVHVIMASNEDWVVPAGLDNERRFAVFDVTNGMIGNLAGFDAINYQLYQEGGLSAFLYDMLSRDIEGWHPRSKIPVTSALIEQKIAGMGWLESWWFKKLETGSLPRGEGVWEDGRVWVWNHDLLDDVERVSKFTSDYHRKEIGPSVGKRLAKLCPGAAKMRRKVPDERLLEIEVDGRGRATGYWIPPLRDSRRAFEKRLGGAWDWCDEAPPALDFLDG